jgi:hypothetical protein
MTWMGGVKRYCPGLLERLPLIVEIEDQRGGVALGLFQRRDARDHEAEAGHALEAFVARGRERVEFELGGIDRQRAERAHRIDQKPAPVFCRGGRDALERVEDSARRLAMDGEDVGDRLVGGERGVELGEVGRRVFRRLVHDVCAAGDGADLGGAVAIGAVDQQQHLAVARHEGGEHRLDGEGAAALHRHRAVRRAAVRDLDQALAHRDVDGDEIRVARAPIVHHRGLDALGGRERAGGQQQGVAGFGGGAGTRGHR